MQLRHRLAVTSTPHHSDSSCDAQVDAFDGTAGRLGPRTYDSYNSTSAPFPDPADYLPPDDYRTYQEWMQYSQKPAGQDYVLPSKDYFSLGKTQPFTGDLNEPGTMQALIKVTKCRDEG